LNRALRLREPLGDRAISNADLPLALGGEGVSISIPGVPAGVIAAYVGFDEQTPYVEVTADSGVAVTLNGRVLRERTPLLHGDVIRIGAAQILSSVRGASVALEVIHHEGNATQPPIIDPAELEEDQELAPDSQAIRRVAFKPVLAPKQQVRRRAHPQRVVLTLGLTVLGLGLWMLITAKPLHVIVDPRDSPLDLRDTSFDFRVGDRIFVRTGSHVLVASHAGYETAQLPVQVSGKPDEQVRLTLKKLPGEVHVQAGDVEASLVIDGKPIGKVPGAYRVAAGKHQFRVAAPHYQEFISNVEVKGLGQKQTVTFKLRPLFSPVTIESEPSGARVALDGKEIGVTPLTAQIDAGTYSLSLLAQGFRPWENSIQVKAETPQKIGPVKLGLPDGTLSIRSSPSQADVAVAGRYRGRTPLDVSLPPGVEFEIALNHGGYEPARRVVAVKPGERSGMEMTLKPILGEVNVRGDPADAQLFVDGQARGSANQTIMLPSTELTLEIRREGYQSFTTKVVPQAGLARVVEYRLLTPEQARAARIPPLIKTHTNGQMRRIPPGHFTMGSSRREPGRRSNETEHEVTLQRTYYLGVYEVTNAEFRQFQPDHLSGVVRDRSLDQDDHPVVNVTWSEAAAFCNWLSSQDGLPAAYTQQGDNYALVTPVNTGYRLPTEAEWEWAARYEGGQASRRYPWGSSLPVPTNSGNFADKRALAVNDTAVENYEDGFVTTAPVGRFPANPLGLYDIGGNVTEWVQDFYTVYPELEPASTDPLGPATGTQQHVVRGSSWRSANVAELRLAWRDHADGKAQHIGFRIARYAE
jgi:formylglycine-generating enzyme required for sulfatase activity